VVAENLKILGAILNPSSASGPAGHANETKVFRRKMYGWLIVQDATQRKKAKSYVVQSFSSCKSQDGRMDTEDGKC
jgi:hypothetical protein